MREHELHPAPGSRKARRRRGRGDSSGRGSYSGSGQKGQKSRTGGAKGPAFEGGQISLIKRLPHKRGFINLFRVEYQPVNLERLNGMPAGVTVTPESLREAGIINTLRQPVAILGQGELVHPLTVQAHRFSAAARGKITAAGGTVEVLPAPVISRPR